MIKLTRRDRRFLEALRDPQTRAARLQQEIAQRWVATFMLVPLLASIVLALIAKPLTGVATDWPNAISVLLVVALSALWFDADRTIKLLLVAEAGLDRVQDETRSD